MAFRSLFVCVQSYIINKTKISALKPLTEQWRDRSINKLLKTWERIAMEFEPGSPGHIEGISACPGGSGGRGEGLKRRCRPASWALSSALSWVYPSAWQFQSLLPMACSQAPLPTELSELSFAHSPFFLQATVPPGKPDNLLRLFSYFLNFSPETRTRSNSSFSFTQDLIKYLSQVTTTQ